MLSAIGSASYKSSLYTHPRTEDEIDKEKREISDEITKALDHFKGYYCDLLPEDIDHVSMFQDLAEMQKLLPQFFDTLENLEEELMRARYEPEPEEDL